MILRQSFMNSKNDGEKSPNTTEWPEEDRQRS